MSDEMLEEVFDLDAPLDFPSDITIYKSSDAIIACSPSIASWIVLKHSLAPQILHYLINGKSLQQAIDCISRNINDQSTMNAVQELLGEIVDKNFRRKAVVQKDLSLSPYITLSMNITDACNLRCITCYRYCGKPKSDELTQSEWLELVSEHHSLDGKIVKISGGEPLFRDKQLIYKIIRKSKKLGMWVLLLSNGTLIDHQTANTLDNAGLDRIQISLDGPDKESNDSIRGQGVFSKVMKTLDILCNATKIDVYLAVLPVPKISLDVLIEKGEMFARNLKDRFGNRITISVSQGMLDGREVRHDESLSYMKACRNLQNIMGSDSQTMAGIDLWQWEPGRRNISCGYGRTLGIEPNGIIRACAGGEEVGNVRESPLSDIIERLKILALSHTVDTLDECRKCGLKYLCGGPCRVRPELCVDDRKLDLLDRLSRSNSMRYEVEQSE